MTPQSSFMIMAPVDPKRDDELRRLLTSMNVAPGCVNPANAIIPFGQFDALHFARIVILDDKTVEDLAAYGLPRPNYPAYLAFLGDLDGDADAFLQVLATRCAHGLRAIFSCCESFTADADLYHWMKAHDQPAVTNYVNWRGRTVRQIWEEAALYDAIERYVEDNASTLAGRSPRDVHAKLRRIVDDETAAGRLTLSKESPTPFGWWLGNVLHLVGAPLLLVLTSPLLIVIAVIFLIRLRQLEKTDPEICPRVDPKEAEETLAVLEDREATNSFTVMGNLKPGFVRRWTMAFVLLLVEYTARHIYTHGRLARVHSIHFARWVYLDGMKRLMFASNYDGSRESYMDDFINKVGFGLNVVFGNGIGYPRTDWLFLGGSKDEQKFKYILRRHQLPTQVWYNAHPGLTAVDLDRNARLRKGLESASMTEQELVDWTALL